ncbi:MerR family transcriptional regulator [Promicromonospora sp. NPDC050249]|uniref:MerR family transcriptional regulator n=1 Tax=Promicromonospora sp. NPDC050249 TaxID=3154743 RepID=UPI0033EF2CBF
MTGDLTIGQAAAFAGVTVKTVRHYHRLGLVEEPRRDSLGYRRYGSAGLLRLVQVRTLADAGVPLSRIGTMLDADPQQFAGDLADVKQRLTDRIQELVVRRDTLDRLAAGNRLLLPDRACALLERAAALGFPQDYLAQSLEHLVLAKALVPWDFDSFIAQSERALDDAQYVALLKRNWEARMWDPDDPRVDALATEIADHLLANPEILAIATSLRSETDALARYGLISDYQAQIAPALGRLMALVEAVLRSADIDILRQPT